MTVSCPLFFHQSGCPARAGLSCHSTTTLQRKQRAADQEAHPHGSAQDGSCGRHQQFCEIRRVFGTRPRPYLILKVHGEGPSRGLEHPSAAGVLRLLASSSVRELFGPRCCLRLILLVLPHGLIVATPMIVRRVTALNVRVWWLHICVVYAMGEALGNKGKTGKEGRPVESPNEGLLCLAAVRSRGTPMHKASIHRECYIIHNLPISYNPAVASPQTLTNGLASLQPARAEASAESMSEGQGANAAAAE